MSNTATRDELTGTIHTAEVETIAAGGAGVARLDGRAVFIPRTVPGDRVSFRVAGGPLGPEAVDVET